MNSIDEIEKAIEKSGIKIDNKLKSMLILIVEACKRRGYNQAVKDWKNGFSLKYQDVDFLKRREPE